MGNSRNVNYNRVVTKDYTVYLIKVGNEIILKELRLDTEPRLRSMIMSFTNARGRYISTSSLTDFITRVEKDYPLFFDYNNQSYCLDYEKANSQLIDLRNVDLNEIDDYLVYKSLWGYYKSYQLNKNYALLDKDEGVLAYSHRRRGWSNKQKFQMSVDFNAEIHTNFGYGRSTFFTTTLELDGVKLIPYCKIVLYRNKNASEVLMFTRAFENVEESWISTFKFIVDTYKQYNSHKNQNYLLEYGKRSLEDFALILNKVLTSNAFFYVDDLVKLDNILRQDVRTYIDDISRLDEVVIEYSYDGLKLYEYRYEVVMNTLNLLSNIDKLSSRIGTTRYSKKIRENITKFLLDLSILLEEVKEKYQEVAVSFEKEETMWKTSEEFYIEEQIKRVYSNYKELVANIFNRDQDMFNTRLESFKASVAESKYSLNEFCGFDEKCLRRVVNEKDYNENLVVMNGLYVIINNIRENKDMDETIDSLENQHFFENFRSIVDKSSKDSVLKLYFRCIPEVDFDLLLIADKREKYDELKNDYSVKEKEYSKISNMYETLSIKKNNFE